ncbi:carboxymuconolactone decarboxylase family protein [Rhizobium sp. CG4]|uniref:carboxymuconolactone decarboxylase family protein n=1 Tax=Rhizobium sp. CG4 TaxID=2726075 RepID=UPI0020342E63|nr:carboxymuconolactone decarboxylase family protein [Rhizobium sp. CG4]MCM2457598.1 carboxymuconolactone decarboxylase family protein [Rhizobium sp. CG4]
MKTITALALIAFGITPALAQETTMFQTTAPALDNYDKAIVKGELWQRPQLSPRDRSIVTVAALIARNQPTVLSDQVELALDNGVKPSEISEILTHLAFYAGWGNAQAAAPEIAKAFTARNIDISSLPAAKVELNPVNPETEAVRTKAVENLTGSASPGLEHFTTNPLFLDLWLRPDLKPRDRSLVTVTSLISLGQSMQIPYHLNRAMDNGLTAEEAGEVVTHLAFYAGWPNAFSAAPVVRDTVKARP